MRPLTKTVARRSGGLAAQIVTDEEKHIPSKPKVANVKPVANVANSGRPKDRVTRWREANPELYKERQRAYQAEYRRRKKASSPTAS